MQSNIVFLLVGVPGSGKTWVASKLTDAFQWVPHDDYDERIYGSILFTNCNSLKPVLGEIPFGLSKFQDQLEQKGIQVRPVFILEDESVLRTRWKERGTAASAQKGHITRQETYRQRAAESGAFCGTSSEVLEYLKGLSK